MADKSPVGDSTEIVSLIVTENWPGVNDKIGDSFRSVPNSSMLMDHRHGAVLTDIPLSKSTVIVDRLLLMMSCRHKPVAGFSSCTYDNTVRNWSHATIPVDRRMTNWRVCN